MVAEALTLTSGDLGKHGRLDLCRRQDLNLGLPCLLDLRKQGLDLVGGGNSRNLDLVDSRFLDLDAIKAPDLDDSGGLDLIDCGGGWALTLASVMMVAPRPWTCSYRDPDFDNSKSLDLLDCGGDGTLTLVAAGILTLKTVVALASVMDAVAGP